MEISRSTLIEPHSLTDAHIGRTVEFTYQKYGLGWSEAGTGRVRGLLHGLENGRIHLRDSRQGIGDAEFENNADPLGCNIGKDSVIGKVRVVT